MHNEMHKKYLVMWKDSDIQKRTCTFKMSIKNHKKKVNTKDRPNAKLCGDRHDFISKVKLMQPALSILPEKVALNINRIEWRNNEVEQSVEDGSAQSQQIRKNKPLVELFHKYTKE